MIVALTGKVILVTGAASGIGAAIALAAAEAGAEGLMLTDRDAAGLAKTAGALPAENIRTRVADLADPAAPDQIIDAALAAFGRIDGLAGKDLELEHLAHKTDYTKLKDAWRARQSGIDRAVAELKAAGEDLCDRPDLFLGKVDVQLKRSEHRSDPAIVSVVSKLSARFTECLTHGLNRLPLATRRDRLGVWRKALNNTALSET